MTSLRSGTPKLLLLNLINSSRLDAPLLKSEVGH